MTFAAAGIPRFRGLPRMRRSIALLVLMLLLTACALFGRGEYVVFFPERSAELDAPARGIIANAARQAQQDPSAAVSVIGFTDSAGSPQADIILSQNRAQTVADALVADGVPASRVARQGRGPTGGDPGLASRRVEIKIGSF
jgi:outer membrane protein OmpA-like peptidoglycan-associated protein